jgi:hypothetical protein
MSFSQNRLRMSCSDSDQEMELHCNQKTTGLTNVTGRKQEWEEETGDRQEDVWGIPPQRTCRSGRTGTLEELEDSEQI